MELKKNTLLNKRYRIIKTISTEGGFSNIYLCKDNVSRKRVSIKELYPEETVVRCGDKLVIVNDEKFDNILDSFMHEVEILKKVKHNSIIEYLDFFTENNTCYLVYVYEKGKTLKYYVKEKKTLGYDMLVFILKELLHTVHYLHKNNILHRDIKPGNILVSKNQIKLIDFGSSTYLDNRRDKYLKVTEGFSPIEFYATDGPQTYSADIYSLFATLYYLIEGKKLASSPKRFFNEELHFSKLNVDWLKELIVKNLSVDSKQRDKSIEDLIENLDTKLEYKQE